ncbi:MAG TPA: lipoyl(octanoyl) transferase LipB [Streptosporangiaceae bacterium]|nr:lipoyl(octanoyl) transferase LipB [Streptosporangiaceae bacterium]
MRDELVFARLGLGVRTIGYTDAWELQRQVHQQRVAGLIPDTCLLLEHAAVYTAGKRTTPLDRPVGDPGAPVIDVDRGGNITWHGPGQLVGYPIVALDEPMDVVAYVHGVEEALIGVCREFGVPADRVEGRRGVWVTGGSRDRKVAAIGVRVARGVTMHGFALNCDCDLSWYDRIVPCGISDASVTTLTAETGRQVTVTDVLPAVEHHLAAALGASTVRATDGVPLLVLSGTGQRAIERHVPHAT